MMANLKGKSGKKLLARIGVLGVAGLSLSGCYTGFDGGYYDAGYASNYYCDPYSAYDAYYDCDTGYGFGNIGFSGGWYDSYYYPGYGGFIFDNYGRRFDMGDRHRRYWSGKRHEWQRNGGDRRGRGHWQGNDNRGNGDWNGNNGNWRRDRDRDGRDGNRDWGRRGDGDREGWRGRGRGNGDRNWQGNSGATPGAVVTPQPRPDNPGRRGDGGGRSWRGNGDGNGNAGAVRPGRDRNYAAPSVQQAPQRAAPVQRSAPARSSNNGSVRHPRNGNVREQ